MSLNTRDLIKRYQSDEPIERKPDGLFTFLTICFFAGLIAGAYVQMLYIFIMSVIDGVIY